MGTLEGKVAVIAGATSGMAPASAGFGEFRPSIEHATWVNICGKYCRVSCQCVRGG
jgi:hypothetical protein